MYQQAVRQSRGGLPGGVSILCCQQALHNLQNDCFWKHLFAYYIKGMGNSLAAQWRRTPRPVQEIPVRFLIREDPTCHGAAKPVSHAPEPGRP